MRFVYPWFVLVVSCADGVVGVSEDSPDITIPSEEQEPACKANGVSSTAMTSNPTAVDERPIEDISVACGGLGGCSEPACADSAACRCTTVTLVSGIETGVDAEPFFGLAERTPAGTVTRGTSVELLRFWLQPNPDCEPGMALDLFTVKLVGQAAADLVEIELWDEGTSVRLDITVVTHGLVGDGLLFTIKIPPFLLGVAGGTDRHEFSVRTDMSRAPADVTIVAALVPPVRWRTESEPARVLETQDHLPIVGETLTVASE